MAKKKVILEGQVILDDKGTLKDTAKGAHSVDRRLKGAARTSSNTTKNFSKMSQGISGGLVPAYATLAANIFAIGAAFRFLSDAADYRILVEGQREYATVTGEALELLTGRLQEATGNQLAFAEAAQSVAIARAAGVTSDQIERLGVLAKNASIALGRDLTDSLNRLIRGVTKAEPELLDELGIILRLEVASRKYALEIGKTKEQLTIFEKSQAVVNEVLDQGEEKFGNFNTALNEFSKGAKKFDDLLNKIKGTVTVLAEFIAKGLSANMVALGASMGIVASSILKSIVPAAVAIDRTKSGQAAMKNVGKFYTGSRADKFADGTASQADVKALKRSMNAKKSTVLNFENFKRSEAKKTIKIIEMYNLEREAQEGGSFVRMKAKFLLSLKSMQLEYGKFIGTMKFAWLGFTKFLSFVGWAGMAFSLMSVLKPLFDRFKDPDVLAFEESQKRLIEKYKKQTEALRKLNTEMQRTNTLMAGLVQLSNFYGNFSFAGAAGALGQAAAGTKTVNIPTQGQQMAQGFGAGAMGGSAYTSMTMSTLIDVPTLSEAQLTILTDTNEALKIQQSRLNEGSKEYKQITGFIQEFEAGIEASNSQTGISEEHVQRLARGLTYLGEEGTFAQKGLEGFASTTQILAGATQNFSQAMASLKSRATGLTQITDSISGVGSALTTLGTGDYSGYKDMNEAFRDVTDKGTLALARTFIGDEAVENILDSSKYTQQEKLAELGKQIEAEAKRLHIIEIGLMTDKMNIETALINAKRGMPKLVGAQLAKEGKVKILNQQILDAEILREELKKKGSEESAAQLVLEDAKLSKLKAQLETAKRASEFAFQAIDTFTSALETGLTKAFSDFATGAKNMKDAFLDMTQAILKAMIQILAQQAAIKAMGFFGFPTGSGGRSGGIFNPPGYRSFAGGGIATGSKSGYPATLHGTEAVVPLGNDRSIPVEFKGGGGSTSNITVNVSTTGGQQTTSAGAGEKERKLGQMIAAAVQGEILDQQRPGGILSPYGDGGP